MEDMATEIDVLRMALHALGESKVPSAVDEPGPNAEAFRLYLRASKDKLLMEYVWTFASEVNRELSFKRRVLGVRGAPDVLVFEPPGNFHIGVSVELYGREAPFRRARDMDGGWVVRVPDLGREGVENGDWRCDYMVDLPYQEYPPNFGVAQSFALAMYLRTVVALGKGQRSRRSIEADYLSEVNTLALWDSRAKKSPPPGPLKFEQARARLWSVDPRAPRGAEWPGSLGSPVPSGSRV